LARRRPMNVARPAADDNGAVPASGATHAAVSPETAWVIAEARRKRAWQAAMVGGLLLLSLVSLAFLRVRTLGHTARPVAAGAPSLPAPPPGEPAQASSPPPAATDKPAPQQPAPEPRLIPPG